MKLLSRRFSPSAFTLIELLVVIAIIGILAALLFPVLSQAKAASQQTNCISNVKDIATSTMLYQSDFDGEFPRTKRRSANPEEQDADGGIEEPEYGHLWRLLSPYVRTDGPTGQARDGNSMIGVWRCPNDPNPSGADCLQINPDELPVASYLVNGSFVWGLNESAVAKSAETILLAERRSHAEADQEPFCDYMYRPWFNSANPKAPSDEMAELGGAIATRRHHNLSNFAFADGHVKAMPWSQTFSLPDRNLHSVRQ